MRGVAPDTSSMVVGSLGRHGCCVQDVQEVMQGALLLLVLIWRVACRGKCPVTGVCVGEGLREVEKDRKRSLVW